MEGCGKTDADTVEQSLQPLLDRAKHQDGDDVIVTWTTAGGRANTVEMASNRTGGYTNISPNIILPGSGDTITNYFDPGAATNSSTRYYRIRLVP